MPPPAKLRRRGVWVTTNLNILKTHNPYAEPTDKLEFSKILSCYSLGVSRGKWKDYAIDYNKNEVNFLMYKNSLASPDCILTKLIKSKKNRFIFKLNMKNKMKNSFKEIDDLLVILKRKHFIII